MNHKKKLRIHAIDEHHVCDSYREGDWLIFYCPLCPGYQRKENLKTDETVVDFGEYGHIRHSGFHFPSEARYAMSYQN